MPRQITVYAVSDMTGETVARLVRAASAQFPTSDVTIKVLQHATSSQQVFDYNEGQWDDLVPCADFHTILTLRMREDLRAALQTLRIPSVDLLGSTSHVMAELLGKQPQETPGLYIDVVVKSTLFEVG